MKVMDIMTEEPACCTAETNLEEAARMMCDHNCGELPVIDNEQDRRPFGVITDRDIVCRGVAKAKVPQKTTVRECMTEHCVTISYDADLEECCELLEQHKIRRIPVIDEDGRCCGIISQADIARYAPEETLIKVLQEVSQP